MGTWLIQFAGDGIMSLNADRTLCVSHAGCRMWHVWLRYLQRAGVSGCRWFIVVHADTDTDTSWSNMTMFSWASFFLRSWNLEQRELYDMLRRLIMRVLQCSVGGVGSSRRHLLICRRRQVCKGWTASGLLLHVRSKTCVGACVGVFLTFHPRRLPLTRRRPAYTLRRYSKLVYRT